MAPHSLPIALGGIHACVLARYAPLASATMRRTSLPGTMGPPAALCHIRGTHLSQLLALEFV